MMDPVMALLERSASPLDAAAGHAEYVYSVAEGRDVSAGDRRSIKLLAKISK